MDGQPKLEIERERSATEADRRHVRALPALPVALPDPCRGRGRPLRGDRRWRSPARRPHRTASAQLPRRQLLARDPAFLVTPLISALHVHAVDDVREGRDPTLGSVARRGLTTLPRRRRRRRHQLVRHRRRHCRTDRPRGPLAGFGGRSSPQAAALEGEGWIDALRRSRELTKGNYCHIFGPGSSSGDRGGVPLDPRSWLRRPTIRPPPFRSSSAPRSRSSSAPSPPSATALPLFRPEGAAPRTRAGRPRVPSAPESSSGRVVPPTGHPLDPASWSDEDRPAVGTSTRTRRGGCATGPPTQAQTWSKRTTKTPKQDAERVARPQVGRERKKSRASSRPARRKRRGRGRRPGRGPRRR